MLSKPVWLKLGSTNSNHSRGSNCTRGGFLAEEVTKGCRLSDARVFKKLSLYTNTWYIHQNQSERKFDGAHKICLSFTNFCWTCEIKIFARCQQLIFAWVGDLNLQISFNYSKRAEIKLQVSFQNARVSNINLWTFIFVIWLIYLFGYFVCK